MLQRRRWRAAFYFGCGSNGVQHLCNQQRRWWHAVIVVLLTAEAEVACSVHALVTALWYAAEAEVACSIFVASMVTALWCIGWRRLRGALAGNGFVVRRVSTAS